jgi:HAD superfamily hydrolase (TIGR01509 family)
MIKAVIFDLDGVLIDSEPLHFKSDNLLLRELGIHAPENYFDRFVGLTDSTMWEAIKIDYHITKCTDELLKMQLPIKLNLLQGGDYKIIPGIVELLEQIKAMHMPIAVASSSSKQFIEAVIEQYGLIQYFKIIVSGEDVERSKPEPDIFLRAAELLNAKPSECLVVEDSKSGTIGAKKAGMMCIGFQNLNSGNQDLSQADFIVLDIREIDIKKMI